VRDPHCVGAGVKDSKLKSLRALSLHSALLDDDAVALIAECQLLETLR
jgi:hypothetical protein